MLSLLIYPILLVYCLAFGATILGLNFLVSFFLALVIMNSLYLFQCDGFAAFNLDEPCFWHGMFLMIPASIGLIFPVAIGASFNILRNEKKDQNLDDTARQQDTAK